MLSCEQSISNTCIRATPSLCRWLAELNRTFTLRPVNQNYGYKKKPIPFSSSDSLSSVGCWSADLPVKRSNHDWIPTHIKSVCQQSFVISEQCSVKERTPRNITIAITITIEIDSWGCHLVTELTQQSEVSSQQIQCHQLLFVIYKKLRRFTRLTFISVCEAGLQINGEIVFPKLNVYLQRLFPHNVITSHCRHLQITSLFLGTFTDTLTVTFLIP